MEAPRFEEIAAHCEESQSALRDLNNANARETSFLTKTDWAAFVAEAFAAICVSDTTASFVRLISSPRTQAQMPFIRNWVLQRSAVRNWSLMGSGCGTMRKFFNG